MYEQTCFGLVSEIDFSLLGVVKKKAGYEINLDAIQVPFGEKLIF
jgi:hypothetical protein